MQKLYLTITMWVRDRIDHAKKHPEAGYSTEAVIATAILAALALLVLGTILWDKIVDKANSIDLG